MAAYISAFILVISFLSGIEDYKKERFFLACLAFFTAGSSMMTLIYEAGLK